MRNQYKILAEKYELVLEASMEQPAQQGREIKGVFVPAEIENWINTMIKTPIYDRKEAIRTGSKIIPIGYKDRKVDQDFEPEELSLIVKKIYNKWKNSSFEEIQQALKARGAIGRSLTQVRYVAKLTPARRVADQLKSSENRNKNNLKHIQDYNANPIQVPNNILKILAKIVLTRAEWRAKVEKLPFFYEVDANRPHSIIKKERSILNYERRGK